MLESGFQAAMAREFAANGWRAKHLSPPSERGFPDHLVTRWNRFFYIEYKEIETFESRRKLGSIMEDAQLPWAINHLKDGGAPVILAVQTQTKLCGWIELHDPTQILTLKERRLTDVPFHLEASVGALSLSILRAVNERGYVYC